MSLAKGYNISVGNNNVYDALAKERLELVHNTPQLKLIEWLLRAKASRLLSRHLPIIAAIMAALGYIYYNVPTSVHDLYVMLFFYPLIYAAIVYRLRGALASGVVFVATLLPYSLPFAYDPSMLVRSIVLATFPFLISGLVATQLNYLEQRLDAYRQIISLNEALNSYIERLESTQKQLIHAEKLNAIGQLAASVAHELNNPLAGVLVYAKLLSKKLNSGTFNKDDGIATLSKMEAAVAQCSSIIRGLLDFARQSEPGSQPVAIKDILDQVIGLADHKAEMAHVAISRDDEPSLPPVMSDSSQLQQVFLNLAVNAIEAMPEGGKLDIRSYLTNDGWVTVVFRDTGTGIAPENMDKLFTPFFTTKPLGKGVGLGLAISYGIIEQHGGKIEVQSQPGDGSTFTVSLPAYTYKGEVG